MSDPAYRIIRRLIPGPYTFLLPATKAVPRLVMNPKRKTTGIRVPDSPICLSLIEALDNPIISTSALTLVPGAGHPSKLTVQKPALFDALEKLVDVIVDDDRPLAYEVSTILDVTGEEPIILRQGLGWQEAMDWGGQPLSI